MVTIAWIYIVAHLGVTSFRAIARAQKYRYYYLSKGVMPFPRSFLKRITQTYTFIYAGGITMLIVLVVKLLQFIGPIPS